MRYCLLPLFVENLIAIDWSLKKASESTSGFRLQDRFQPLARSGSVISNVYVYKSLDKDIYIYVIYVLETCLCVLLSWIVLYIVALQQAKISQGPL